MAEQKRSSINAILFSLPAAIKVSDEIKQSGDIHTLKLVAKLVEAILHETTESIDDKRGEELLISVGQIKALKELREYFQMERR